VSVLLALVAVVHPTRADESSGKKIGQFVQDAIKTALPGVESLVNLIWGDRKDTDKISKKDLDKAVKDARDEMQSQVKSNASTQLIAARGVADELVVVRDFLDAAVSCSENVIRMQIRLAGKAKAPDSMLWNQLSNDWAPAKGYLETVKGIPRARVDTINNIYLRGKIDKIRLANIEHVTRIDGFMARKSTEELPEFEKQLEKLQEVLQGISAAAGYMIADLSHEMQEVANWASPPDTKPSGGGVAAFRAALDKVE